MVAYVVVPGIDGSDERRRQSLWEHRWGASAVRIAPAPWSTPDLSDWVAALHTAYESAARNDGQVASVAHSLGCRAAVQWLDGVRPESVVAFLAAPPDPRGPAFPRRAAPTFLDLSARPLPCRSLMVASDDDPYCDPATSASFAHGWQARRHLLAGHGHINSDSGLGDRQAGQELLALLHG